MIEFFLARRYLSSQQGRGLSVITWIALSGVIVGVMSLVTVLAVMSGFEQELKTKILGNNAHLLVRGGFNLEESELQSILEKVRATDGVASAMNVIYGEAFLLGKSGGAEGAFVKAVNSKDVQEVLDLKDYVQNQNWNQFDEGQVILGSTLAARLSVDVGDSVTFIVNQPEISPLGVMPRMKRVKVADIFYSGMTQYDSQNAYVPISLGKKIFDKEPQQIEVRTENLNQIGKIKTQLQATLGEDFRVFDWLMINKDFLSALQLEKIVMALILGLIVLVAAFNICGSLIMIVRDKTKDIAILKSMGGDSKMVHRIFLYQGLFIGLVGTVVGLVLGLALSFLLRDQIRFPLNPEVYMIDRVPVDIRATDLIFVTIGALVISLIATLYPARLASQLEPTEGLKVE